MGTPSAAVGDTPDLLDVDVHHVTRAFGDDRTGPTIAVAGGIDESALVQPEPSQDPGNGAATDLIAVLVEFRAICDADDLRSRRHLDVQGGLRWYGGRLPSRG